MADLWRSARVGVVGWPRDSIPTQELDVIGGVQPSGHGAQFGESK